MCLVVINNELVRDRVFSDTMLVLLVNSSSHIQETVSDELF